jgi:cytochrome c peroxidase
MKRLYIIPFLMAIFLVINAFYTPQQPVEQIQTTYLSSMTAFELSIKNLKNEIEKGPLSISDLQKAFKAARLAYKKVAWLIGYLEPENEKNFNGAPLTKVENIHFTEIEPLGFQPIEEIVFGEDVTAELPKLRQLVNDLSFYANRWTVQMGQNPFTDREIFEAFRAELIQLFTLSLTGFDSPVAFHSIPEGVVAWSSLEANFNFYQKNLEKKDKILSNLIKNLFSEGKSYLIGNQDFNSFNRLFFYKKYINPLYQSVAQAQRILGIEFYALTGNPMRAWNDEASNIFDKNLVNPRYYSSPKQKDFHDKMERITLGQFLFFDPIMSINGKRACASCHNADKAFSENITKSLDLEGNPVARNAPSLPYAALSTTQFWDGHAKNVEEQMAHVSTNLKEMGNAIEDLPTRLAQSAEYRNLFKNAFSNDKNPLSIINIERAMGSYLRSLATFDSDFDRYMRNEKATIDPSVERGFNLFMGKAKCGTCHFAPVFNGTVPPQYLDTEFEVLGVPNADNKLDGDMGRYNIIPAEKYRNSFKTVTVRNAALTAPYMHNGRYKTLEEVVDFYSKGGGKGLGLDVPNQTLPFDKLDLLDKEIKDIVAFMKALTDKTPPKMPSKLPVFEDKKWENRKIGGEY